MNGKHHNGQLWGLSVSESPSERSEQHERIVMCIEIGEMTEPAEVLGSQARFIRCQEQDETPAQHLKIRCVCLKLVNMKYAYRCLYCGIFYCKQCAEQHFGKTVAEYRAERDT